MPRSPRKRAYDVGLMVEQVGRHHDSRLPCALCTVLLAEGVTGEGWPTESILNAPELVETLDLFHVSSRSERSENADIDGRNPR